MFKEIIIIPTHNEYNSLKKILKKISKKYKIIVVNDASTDKTNSLLKENGGYGCLLSFELKGGLEETRAFYDSLRISKGPSLGTKFTIVCPYVQLAHYNELDWAESFGIPSKLIRVSVGLEDIEELWEIFDSALENTIP